MEKRLKESSGGEARFTPTVDLENSAERIWDVVVVGAGPAGAMASYQLARRGASVLLVERSSFPRPKVCGSCLNAAAVNLLEAEGLGEILAGNGASPLEELVLIAKKARARISLVGGVVLSREIFDAGLVENSVREGTHFLSQTHATLENKIEPTFRRLNLRQGAKEVSVKVRVVLSADGLGGQLLEKETGFEMRTSIASRVGVGKIVAEAPPFYRSGKIYMACGPGGYLGLVRLEDGRLNLAAAFDPAFLKASGGAGPAVRRTLEENNLPAIEDLGEPWQGTFPLTRRRLRVAGYRIFVIGDSAGYVEPFTGEGIALALASGKEVAEWVLEGVRAWTPGLAVRWTKLHRQRVSRQNFCRFAANILRKKTLTHAIVHILSRAPRLAAPFVERVSAPAPLGDD